MNYWWCNQSQCFEVESSAGLVQASCLMSSLRYRETVGEVRSGDLCVHYHKRRGIVAISRAKENAEGIVKLSNLGGLLYERGWRFPAQYQILSEPIPKSKWIEALVPEVNDPHWPINVNGNVKQAYFIPFTLRGYKDLISFTNTNLPKWAQK